MLKRFGFGENGKMGSICVSPLSDSLHWLMGALLVFSLAQED